MPNADEVNQPSPSEVEKASAYEGRRTDSASSVDEGATTPIGHGGAAPPADLDDAELQERRWEGGGDHDS
jgi:hypothetical protein